MKNIDQRGVLTDTIKDKYPTLDRKKLRLLPYLQYLVVNYMPVDPTKIDSEERAILGEWRCMMNNKICVGFLTNIRDMFVIGSKQCEGEALKYQQNFIEALNYAIEAINGTERPQGEWIPVSEKLPEENGRYLVTRGLNACGAMWNRAYIINYSDLMGLKSERIWWDGNVGKSDFKRFDDVIAWMPLPESYKKDGAEE